jgi:hypothetical protein
MSPTIEHLTRCGGSVSIKCIGVPPIGLKKYRYRVIWHVAGTAIQANLRGAPRHWVVLHYLEDDVPLNHQLKTL